MKLRWLFVLAQIPLALAVACASEERTAIQEEAGAPRPTPEAAPPDLDAGGDADAAPVPLCSPDGWCRAEAPDPAPTFEDLWPLATTAFAAGNGLYEFDGERWVFAHPRVSELTSVWAPGPDDVWAAGLYGRILHGVRSAGTWTWTNESIGADTILGLWGAVGPNGTDVYAVTERRGYRRVADGDGSVAWRPEVEDGVTDPTFENQLHLESVSGTGPNDVWFFGRRGSESCSYLVHRVNGRYDRVADCRHVCDDIDCRVEARPPALVDLWTSLHVLTPMRPIALAGEHFVYLTPKPNGAYASTTRLALGLYGQSLWAASETDFYNGGYAQVRRNPDIQKEAGAFEITRIAPASLPLFAVFKVRGTSPTNIWAFGGAYALHKTKP